MHTLLPTRKDLRLSSVGDLFQDFDKNIGIMADGLLLSPQALVAEGVAEQASETGMVLGVRNQNAHNAVGCQWKPDWILEEFGAARDVCVNIFPCLKTPCISIITALRLFVTHLRIGIAKLVRLQPQGIAISLVEAHQIVVHGALE